MRKNPYLVKDLTKRDVGKGRKKSDLVGLVDLKHIDDVFL